MKPLLDRGALGKTAGCLVLIVFFAAEIAAVVAIASWVGRIVAPWFGARSFTSSAGASYWAAVAVGVAVAIPPVVLLDRLARRITGYSPFRAAGEMPSL